ncbi:Uma2 family endonuclease [Nocardia wallacei]|uniref:Uma2 family endonuclease n=1 Tax=Nocardia wallacei TaxID=480035 RepID=UPI00245552CA|nr:Uma2 family endonuclease [Nocardia wallacei]
MTAEHSTYAAGFGPYTVLDLHDLPEDGKGFELEDGWLIEVAAGYRHNWIARRLARVLEAAGNGAIVALDGGEWEVSTQSGVRKPDVVVVDTDLAHALLAEEMPKLIPGAELLLVVEVVSPGSASERTDRVRKVHEYAALRIPQYWLIEQRPDVRVHKFVLDGAEYRCEPVVRSGSKFTAEITADDTFSVAFDPATLLGH